MPTARFAHVVATCGNPEAHFVLTAPEKDRTLQKAIKASRVMTVFQNAVGSKADRGVVGFEAGRARQFLIFPKTLRAFAGKTVIGIKYDLWASKELPKAERAAPPRPKKKPKAAPSAKKPKAKVPPAALSSAKVLPFKPANHQEEDEDDEIGAIKKEVRHAMDVLEEGKAVAAFNLLKRIVEA